MHGETTAGHDLGRLGHRRIDVHQVDEVVGGPRLNEQLQEADARQVAQGAEEACMQLGALTS
jgi:hypothetical protein